VLLVEDDNAVAEMIEIALQPLEEVAVVVLSNGAEALNFLIQRAECVAAVITDLHMPVMNGFELIEKVRAHETYRLLPILVITGDVNPETPSRLEQLSITACFPKPFSPLQIRRRLEFLLRSRS
jgi:CheY-like chemotaxis protein